MKSDWRQAKYFLTKSPAVASSPASLRTKQFIRRGAGLLLQEGREGGRSKHKPVGEEQEGKGREVISFV